MTSRVRNVVRVLLTAWMIGTGLFAFHYGNQPIFTGSNSPTATQTKAVEVKGTIKYITAEEKRLFDASHYTFFGTLGVIWGLVSLRIYGPAAWRAKLEQLDRELRW